MHYPGGSRLLWRLARDGYVLLAIAFLLLRLLQVPPWDQSVDAYAYWSTRDGSMYDGSGAGVLGAYLYSPAFAQLLAPFIALSWPVFVTLWTALNLAVLWWLLGRWSLPAMLFLPIPFEIISGNVHLLYAAAIVAGFRVSATWALPVLTKVTPGVGLLWFAVRREWRPLAIACLATGAIAAASFALDPRAWRDWVGVLSASSSVPVSVGPSLPVVLAIRLPVAVVIVIVAARTGRAWLLPVAVTLSLPVIWINSLAVLAACIPLHGRALQPAADTSALTAFRVLINRVGRALEHPAVMPGIALAGVVFVVVVTGYALRGDRLIGYDAHAYYSAAALDDPYRSTINGGFDATGGMYEYKYPPPLAQILAPLRMVGLPWPAFLAGWVAILLASIAWMGRRWTLLLLMFPPVLGELWLGNLNLLLGLAVVIGMRRPAAWAFIVLTKITPGIGLLWFIARKEWRNLAIALASIAAVSAVSLLLAPSLWVDFLAASRTQLGATLDVPRQAVPVDLPIRLVLAAVVVVWGARTDRAWVLPVAVALSVPFLWWNVLAILVAIIPLAGWKPEVAGEPLGPDVPVPVPRR